jgi:heat shock protein HtpX
MTKRRRDTWTRNRPLERRMGLTLFLLGALYVAFVWVLWVAGIGALVSVGIAAALAVAQLVAGPKLVLHSVRAREVSVAEAPELHSAVERLCLKADILKPRLAVSEIAVPNAFVIGRSRKGMVLCATRDLIKRLDAAELEAVVAHELAHIENRDAVVMTVASFFSVVALYVARFAQFGIHQLVKVAILVASLALYAVSFFLLRALSRYRELAADRTAAVMTGRPSALASALVKLDKAISGAPEKDLRAAYPIAALCLVPLPAKRAWMRALATHPTTERRLAELERLERQLQGSGVTFESLT